MAIEKILGLLALVQLVNLLRLLLLLSMPGYINKVLLRFGHEHPRRVQNSPHPHVVPTYGAKAQYVKNETPSTPLDKVGQKYIQAVTGTLLVAVLQSSCRPNHACCIKCDCNATSLSYSKNNGKSQTIVRLLCESGGSNLNLPCERYGFSSSQRRRIPQREQIA